MSVVSEKKERHDRSILLLAKSDEEKRKLQDFMQQKRQQQEEFFLHDRRQRDEQERARKDKLRKLTEPTSDVSQAQLLSKRPSAFTPVGQRCTFLVSVFDDLDRLGDNQGFHRTNTGTSPASSRLIN